eukprot:6153448-Pleurochrysis_carterae.AAC.1
MDPEATSVPSSARAPRVPIGMRVRTSAHARTEGYEPYVGGPCWRQAQQVSCLSEIPSTLRIQVNLGKV